MNSEKLTLEVGRQSMPFHELDVGRVMVIISINILDVGSRVRGGLKDSNSGFITNYPIVGMSHGIG